MQTIAKFLVWGQVTQLLEKGKNNKSQNYVLNKQSMEIKIIMILQIIDWML